MVVSKNKRGLERVLMACGKLVRLCEMWLFLMFFNILFLILLPAFGFHGNILLSECHVSLR